MPSHGTRADHCKLLKPFEITGCPIRLELRTGSTLAIDCGPKLALPQNGDTDHPISNWSQSGRTSAQVACEALDRGTTDGCHGFHRILR
jgi:hypothetical protein